MPLMNHLSRPRAALTLATPSAIGRWLDTVRLRVVPRVLSVLCVLSLGLAAGGAQAALVRFNFAVDFASGPLGGQTAFGTIDVSSADCLAFVCTGTFTPSGPANAIVGPTGTLLAFSIEVDGVVFDAAGDDLYPDFPSIELSDNQLTRIDFMDFSGPPSLAIFGSALGGWGGQHTNASFDTSLIGSLRQIGGGQAIPEPATLPLLASALLAGLWIARRRSPR